MATLLLAKQMIFHQDEIRSIITSFFNGSNKQKTAQNELKSEFFKPRPAVTLRPGARAISDVLKDIFI